MKITSGAVNSGPKTIGIHFGAMCDSLARQLRSQGVRVKTAEDKSRLEVFQKDADAVTLLRSVDF